MKRLSRFTMLLLATNVLTISALIWGCGTTGGGSPSGGGGGGATTGGATVVAPISGTCCPANCYPAVCDITPRFNTELAVQMIRNYRMYHWTAINANCQSIDRGNPAVVDARSVWFSLTTLKKFINTIETQSCGSTCPPQLGIRIYYAEYPNVASLPSDIDPLCAGKHTVLMVPTYHDVPGNKDVDFDPQKWDKTTCTVSSVFDTATTMCALGADIAAQNHGGLTPPPDPCGVYWNSGASFMKFVDITLDPYSQTSCPPTGR